MPMMKWRGVNELDLSPIARLVYEDLLTRLLAAKSDKDGNPTQYTATAGVIAVALNVPREDVKKALSELLQHGFVVPNNSFAECNGVDFHDARIAIFAEIIEYRGSPTNPAQDALPIDEARPTKSEREEVGEDEIEIEGVKHFATVAPVEDTGNPFELVIMREDAADAIVTLRFGSRGEAWDWFDSWATPPTVDVFEPTGDDGQAIGLHAWFISRECHPADEGQTGGFSTAVYVDAATYDLAKDFYGQDPQTRIVLPGTAAIVLVDVPNIERTARFPGLDDDNKLREGWPEIGKYEAGPAAERMLQALTEFIELVRKWQAENHQVVKTADLPRDG